MVNRNFKQRMRQTLYRLKRDYGSGPVAFYTLVSSTTDVRTGSTTVDKEVTILPRVIVLPVTLSREVIQSISHISANKMFSYGGALDARTRMFIIDQEDAPSLNLQKDSWIVFRNKKYSIKSINDYDFRTAWVVVAQEQVGVVPEQIYVRMADDFLVMEVECATHLTMPVQTALNVLSLYDDVYYDISIDRSAASFVGLISTASAFLSIIGIATSSAETTSQASTSTAFNRITQVTISVGDEAVNFDGLSQLVISELVLDSTGSTILAFACIATDTIELVSTSSVD